MSLTRWAAGMRVIVRREHPHLGAGLTLFEQADAYRYQAFATNTVGGQLAFLGPVWWIRCCWRPGQHDAGHDDAGSVVAGVFVVACGDAAPALESVERSLDDVAVA